MKEVTGAQVGLLCSSSSSIMLL